MEVLPKKRSKIHTAMIVLVWIAMAFCIAKTLLDGSYYIIGIARSLIKNHISVSDYISAYGNLFSLGIQLMLSVLLAVSITFLHRKKAYLPLLFVYFLTSVVLSLCTVVISTVPQYIEHGLFSRIPMAQLIVMFLPTLIGSTLSIVVAVKMLRQKKFGVWILVRETFAVITLVYGAATYISNYYIYMSVIKDIPYFSLQILGNAFDTCCSAMLIAMFTIMGIDDIIKRRRKKQEEMQATEEEPPNM